MFSFLQQIIKKFDSLTTFKFSFIFFGSKQTKKKNLNKKQKNTPKGKRGGSARSKSRPGGKTGGRTGGKSRGGAKSGGKPRGGGRKH